MLGCLRGWRRGTTLATAALLTALVLHPAHAATGGAKGTFTRSTYPKVGAPGARDYWTYVPAGKADRPRPVVVFLHGCNETALEAAAATHLNRLADTRNFIVVYPQQRVAAGSSAPVTDGNGIGCWNWFLPADQARGSGEPATIAGLTQQVVTTLRADPRRVYVEGISAGADLAVILAATYPDRFAAAGALAGCSYRDCQDHSGRLAYTAMGSRARAVPMFIENGTADTVNPLALSVGLSQSWLGVADFVDDGQLNGSVPRTAASTVTVLPTGVPSPGSGDLCVHNNTLTCPGGLLGFQGSYPYTVARYNDAAGCELLSLWMIHGLEHAHPDAPGDGPYTDPLGPDISAASYDFFLRHPMSGGCHR